MLKIIAVTFNHTTELEVFIGSLLLQTSNDWMCEVIHDGPAPQVVKDIMARYAGDNRIVLKCTEKRNGVWGHVSRRIALEQMELSDKDFVLITNCDNVYVPGFVEQVLEQARMREKVGIVYCDTIHSHLQWGYHKSQLAEGFIDMGAAVIRIDIAKSVGFRWDHFSADGKYIQECAIEGAKRGLCNVHISKGIFIHN